MESNGGWRRGEPFPPERVAQWVRTNIRAPGSSWRVEDRDRETRRLGPWHALYPESGHDRAWCSVRPGRVYHQIHRDSPPPTGKHCAKCLRAMARGVPYPYRR